MEVERKKILFQIILLNIIGIIIIFLVDLIFIGLVNNFGSLGLLLFSWIFQSIILSFVFGIIIKTNKIILLNSAIISIFRFFIVFLSGFINLPFNARYYYFEIIRILGIGEYEISTSALESFLAALILTISFFIILVFSAIVVREIKISIKKGMTRFVGNQRMLNQPASTSTNISKTYSCYYCGEPNEKNDLLCSKCNEKILFCSVCKLQIVFGETIGKCSLCDSISHLNHFQEWVKTQGKCPNCLQELPIEGIVPITDDVKK